MNGRADPKPVSEEKPRRRGFSRRGRFTRLTVEEGQAWRRNLGPCQVCPPLGEKCRGPVQAHHIIDAAKLRRSGLYDRLTDHRNRLAVCERAHDRHTSRRRPIPRHLLPFQALVFAAELDLLWYLEDRYPEAVV